MWSTRSNEFSRRCGLRVPSDMLALRNRGQRLVHGGRGAIHRNLAHAEMMVQTADRLVTRSTVKFARGLDHGRERIERTPQPRARRTKNSDGRGAERRRNVQQARVVRHRCRRCRERKNSVA